MSSLVTEPEHGVMIARLAAVVKKEEPIEGILKIVRKYENGIRHEIHKYHVVRFFGLAVSQLKMSAIDIRSV